MLALLFKHVTIPSKLVCYEASINTLATSILVFVDTQRTWASNMLPAWQDSCVDYRHASHIDNRHAGGMLGLFCFFCDLRQRAEAVSSRVQSDSFPQTQARIDEDRRLPPGSLKKCPRTRTRPLRRKSQPHKRPTLVGRLVERKSGVGDHTSPICRRTRQPRILATLLCNGS